MSGLISNWMVGWFIRLVGWLFGWLSLITWWVNGNVSFKGQIIMLPGGVVTGCVIGNGVD